jgi:hypothetical protein
LELTEREERGIVPDVGMEKWQRGREKEKKC